MRNLTTTILAALLLISVGLNIYWYVWPRVEKVKGETVFLPGEKKETIVYKLPEGNQSATVQNVQDYQRATAAAKELLAKVKGIPDLDNEKKITSLMAANARLELSLSEKDMTLNDAEKQRKVWQDKYNSITVNNADNTASVTAEVNPKVATVEKRDKFYLPKESYTVITSENPSVKFNGMESYTFKNPRQKAAFELNLQGRALYLDGQIIPYGGAQAVFNPDGRVRYIVEHGYYNTQQKLLPYWLGGLQLNILKF